MQDYSFPATVSARDIQRGYTTIFNRVKKTNKPIVVMANNTPQAAIISMKTLEELNRQQQKEALFKTIDLIQQKNQGLSEAKTMVLIQKEVEAVRKLRYAKTAGRT